MEQAVEGTARCSLQLKALSQASKRGRVWLCVDVFPDILRAFLNGPHGCVELKHENGGEKLDHRAAILSRVRAERN